MSDESSGAWLVVGPVCEVEEVDVAVGVEVEAVSAPCGGGLIVRGGVGTCVAEHQCGKVDEVDVTVVVGVTDDAAVAAGFEREALRVSTEVEAGLG